MNTVTVDALHPLEISPGEVVRVKVGDRTLIVYQPVGPDDDGPPFESAPPFPDPPGIRILHEVRIGPPEVPERYQFDDTDMAPGFYEDGDDLPADDAGRTAGPG